MNFTNSLIFLYFCEMKALTFDTSYKNHEIVRISKNFGVVFHCSLNFRRAGPFHFLHFHL